MIDLKYSLIIEATKDPEFFGFYSTELSGFSGVGFSIEDCLNKAREGMKEHIEFLNEKNLPIPKENPNPNIIIHNEEIETNNNLKEASNHLIPAIIVNDKYGFHAYCPELKGCLTEGDTYDNTYNNIQEAAKLYLDNSTNKEKKEISKRKIFVETIRF
jgi:predicted RNase H-like HicB family nuclease